MAREFLEFASELAVEAGSLLADYLGRKLIVSKKGVSILSLRPT